MASNFCAKIFTQFITNYPSMNIPINDGVFCRSYHFADIRHVIAYHTPSRSVSLFKGDSAEVWWKLFESKGASEDAIEYIMDQGTFEFDPREEAEALFDGFISGLEEANLLKGLGNRIANAPLSVSRLEASSPEMNPEQEISQLMADNHICYSLSLETTYRCNEKCIHCYLPDDTQLKELSIDQIDKLLQEFVELGGFQLLLTGGEVGIRKDFGEILGLAKKYSLLTSINSNLTCLSDGIIEQLIDLHPRAVFCSIYSAKAALHDSVTCLSGSFERSIATIQRLVDGGVPVAIKTPLMKITAPYWREVEELAQALGCGFEIDLNITAKNDGGMSPAAFRVEDPFVLKEIFRSKHFGATIMNEPIDFLQGHNPDSTICGAGANGLSISPDGMIHPCIGISEAIGNYPSDSISKVWHTSPFFFRWANQKLRDTPCGECVSLGSCSKCPGAWYAEHGNYIQPTAYNCFLGKSWYSACQG